MYFRNVYLYIYIYIYIAKPPKGPDAPTAPRHPGPMGTQEPWASRPKAPRANGHPGLKAPRAQGHPGPKGTQGTRAPRAYGHPTPLGTQGPRAPRAQGTRPTCSMFHHRYPTVACYHPWPMAYHGPLPMACDLWHTVVHGVFSMAYCSLCPTTAYGLLRPCALASDPWPVSCVLWPVFHADPMYPVAHGPTLRQSRGLQALANADAATNAFFGICFLGHRADLVVLK